MPKCDVNDLEMNFIETHLSAWVFSCKFAAYFQSTLLWGHLWRAASDLTYQTSLKILSAEQFGCGQACKSMDFHSSNKYLIICRINCIKANKNTQWSDENINLIKMNVSKILKFVGIHCTLRSGEEQLLHREQTSVKSGKGAFNSSFCKQFLLSS